MSRHVFIFVSGRKVGENRKEGERIIWKGESQNHRMVGVGRDLCGASSPTLLLKQGHLEQVAQDLVQAGFEKENEPAVCPGGQEGQRHPGLYQK